MITRSIQQDTYYTVRNRESVNYEVYRRDTNERIYKGTAYRGNGTDIRIKLNDICSNYIRNEVDEQFFNSHVYSTRIPTFDIYIDGSIQESYMFLPGDSQDLVQPVNGHYIANKVIWHSEYDTCDRITVSPERATVSADGGTVRITVNSCSPWSISQVSTSLTAYPKSGPAGESTVEVTVPRKSGTTYSAWTLIFQNDDGGSATCEIEQEGRIVPPEPEACTVLKYTTTDGIRINPRQTNAIWGENSTFIRNTYKDGKGMIETTGCIDNIPPMSYDTNSNPDALKLKTVEIPETVKKIGLQAFYNASNLESANVPNACTDIQANAFSGCTSLKNLDIDFSVRRTFTQACFKDVPATWGHITFALGTNFAHSTFSGCSGITELTFTGENPYLYNSCFWNCTNLTKVNNFFDRCTVLNDNVFGNTSLSGDIVIGNKCVNILPKALYNTKITSLDTGDKVANIRENAISDCKQLKKLILGNSFNQFYGQGMTGCTALTEIYWYNPNYFMRLTDSSIGTVNDLPNNGTFHYNKSNESNMSEWRKGLEPKGWTFIGDLTTRQ